MHGVSSPRRRASTERSPMTPDINSILFVIHGKPKYQREELLSQVRQSHRDPAWVDVSLLISSTALTAVIFLLGQRETTPTLLLVSAFLCLG